MSKVIKIVIIVLLILAIAFGVYKYKEYLDDKNIGVQLEKISKYEYFVYKNENGLSGVIDNKGNLIIDAKYDNLKIPNPAKDVFACYEGSKVVMKNSKGETLYQNYDYVEPIKLKNIATDLMYEKTVLKYEQDGKYGIIDFSGKKITENIYDSIENLQYREGYLIVTKDNKYGIIDIEGKVLVQAVYDEVASDEFESETNKYKYSGFIVSIKTDDGYKYGYVDYNGKVLLDTKYNDLARFNVINDEKISYILVADNGKYGVYKKSKQIIECEYQNIEYKEAGNVFLIQKAKKYGVANLKGKFILEPNYDQIEVNGIYSYVKQDNQIVVYNEKGKVQNVSNTKELYKVADGKFYITIDNTNNGALYGILNEDKKELVKEQYMYIEYAFDNYFIVSTKEGYGLITSDGTIKLTPENASVQKLLNKNAFQVLKYDSTETEIYSRDISRTCKMENGKIEIQDAFIKVYSENDSIYLDNDGNNIQVSNLEPNSNIYAKNDNGSWGFVDKNGKQILDNKYDRTTELNQYGFAAIKKNGLWGAIDTNGNVIVEPKYKLSQEVLEADFIGKYYKVEYGIGEFYYTDKVN